MDDSPNDEEEEEEEEASTMYSRESCCFPDYSGLMKKKESNDWRKEVNPFIVAIITFITNFVSLQQKTSRARKRTYDKIVTRGFLGGS